MSARWQRLVVVSVRSMLLMLPRIGRPGGPGMGSDMIGCVYEGK